MGGFQSMGRWLADAAATSSEGGGGRGLSVVNGTGSTGAWVGGWTGAKAKVAAMSGGGGRRPAEAAVAAADADRPLRQPRDFFP